MWSKSSETEPSTCTFVILLWFSNLSREQTTNSNCVKLWKSATETLKILHEHKPQKNWAHCVSGSLDLPEPPPEARMPLKTPHLAHFFTSVGILKHFTGFCCWFPEFDKELDVCSVCKIAHVHVHVGTKIYVTPLLLSCSTLLHESLCSLQQEQSLSF